ncbi:odorant receptor 49a-like isoform X2 [Tenebrio molitor]|uniref:odorant receptor 49a-like isoform X2 n=1 Tax=Tenebrio molitor TaxID=7067 RepID=UPI003624A60C
MSQENSEIKICAATRQILRNALIWPKEDEEMNPGKWTYIRILTFVCFTSLLCISTTTHFLLTLENEVERDVSEEMAVLSAIYGTYFMVFAYIKNQKKIASLLRDLSSFDKFGIPEDFHEEEKKLTFYAKFIHTYVTITVSAYNFLLLFLKSDCEKYNKEHDLKENCGLAIPTPFAADYFPVFQLVFLYQLVVSNMLLRLSMIIAYNTFEITQHIIFRINHLNIMTTACFDDDDYQTSRNKLTRCILYHSEVLDFAKRVDDCFSSCMFAHLILTSTICACLEKQITVGINRFGGVLHILGWIVNLFVSCLAGQRLINANGTIAEAIWASKWYQADVRLQKDVRLMLLRSQRDLHLSAGPFGIVSFALFVSVSQRNLKKIQNNIFVRYRPRK